MGFTDEERTPNPERLIQAYGQSSATLNLVRAFTQGGYADIRNVHKWMLGFVDRSPLGARYQALAVSLNQALGVRCALLIGEAHRIDIVAAIGR
ncbi:MAG: 3-deoxy-7-phosphoheptulonate synthase [Pseudomonadota bacterium]